HALDDLIGDRVDPHQLALFAALNGDRDHVLGGGRGDAVRVGPDLNAAEDLVGGRVDHGDVLAAAVGDVQLGRDLALGGGTAAVRCKPEHRETETDETRVHGEHLLAGGNENRWAERL